MTRTQQARVLKAWSPDGSTVRGELGTFIWWEFGGVGTALGACRLRATSCHSSFLSVFLYSLPTMRGAEDGLQLGHSASWSPKNNRAHRPWTEPSEIVSQKSSFLFQWFLGVFWVSNRRRIEAKCHSRIRQANYDGARPAKMLQGGSDQLSFPEVTPLHGQQTGTCAASSRVQTFMDLHPQGRLWVTPLVALLWVLSASVSNPINSQVHQDGL